MAALEAGGVVVATAVGEPVACDTDALVIMADGIVAAIKPLLVILLFIRFATVGVIEFAKAEFVCCVCDDAATGCKAVPDELEPDDKVDCKTAPALLITTVSLLFATTALFN